MANDRKLIIYGPDNRQDELVFDSAELRDSEALHQLLCSVDPGENYNVVFRVVYSGGKSFDAMTTAELQAYARAHHSSIARLTNRAQLLAALKKADCRHVNLIEVGSIDCGYCCKVVKCEKCGKEFDSHRKIYGCPQGV